MTHRGASNFYIVEAHPHQLADDSRWTMNITIERQEGDALEGVHIADASAMQRFIEIIW